jgi:hypothetical protein
MRAVDLARHLGVSRPHFYRKLRRQLTAYEVAGVPVFSVAEAEGLVRPRTKATKRIERTERAR